VGELEIPFGPRGKAPNQKRVGAMPIPEETWVPRAARDDSEKKKLGNTEERKSLWEWLIAVFP